MANDEHLKILKQGTVVWNKWRESNPEIIPELEKVNIRRADLSYADLSKANLVRGPI